MNIIVPIHSLSSLSDTNTKDNPNSNINSHVKDFKETNKYPLDNVEDFDDVINGGGSLVDGVPTTVPNIENPFKNVTEDDEVDKVGSPKETDIANESVIMSIPTKSKSSEELGDDNQTTSNPVEMEASNLNRSDVQKAPFTLENVNREDDLIRAETEHKTRKSKELSAEYRQSRVLNTTDGKEKQNKSLEEKFNIDEPEGNISSEALSIQVGLLISNFFYNINKCLRQNTYFLDAGSISGICVVAVAISFAAAFGGVFLYRRRYNNKPQALSEPDLSVYIDDSTIRDNSDEMYSLDNDSFLNSLEAMTIQNYWTDTVKHTKL